MAGFFYYLPDCDQSTKAADVRAAGLAYAFDDQVAVRQCMRGPDGNAGVIAALGDRGLGYFPSKQQWRQIPGLAAWVGMCSDDRPTPADLLRAEPLDGDWVRTEDGNRWLIPKARRWFEFEGDVYPVCNLPQRLSLSDGGRWEPGAVKKRYATLWQWACEYEQAFAQALQTQQAGGVIRFQFDRIDDLAIAALQANYRVSAVELDMLGVYDLQVREQTVAVLLDDATWQAWVKKKVAAADPSGGSSSSGPAPSMPVGAAGTDQPSPNCEPMPQGCTTT